MFEQLFFMALISLSLVSFDENLRVVHIFNVFVVIVDLY